MYLFQDAAQQADPAAAAGGGQGGADDAPPSAADHTEKEKGVEEVGGVTGGNGAMIEVKNGLEIYQHSFAIPRRAAVL